MNTYSEYNFLVDSNTIYLEYKLKVFLTCMNTPNFSLRKKCGDINFNYNTQSLESKCLYGKHYAFYVVFTYLHRNLLFWDFSQNTYFYSMWIYFYKHTENIGEVRITSVRINYKETFGSSCTETVRRDVRRQRCSRTIVSSKSESCIRFQRRS